MSPLTLHSLLESLHMILIAHAIYFYTIFGRGDILCLRDSVW